MSTEYSSEYICLVCQSTDILVFAEISQLPVHCNLLWKTREEAVISPREDIRLGFCKTCGHIFNVSFDHGHMKYSQAYENSLHSSPRFQAYANSLAARLIGRYDLRGKDIIEIGCGKGEFLSLLCDMGGNRGLGFDPSYDDTRQGVGATGKVTVIRDFYSEKYAEQAADLICCRHVLEHIQYPRDFLLQLHRVVGERQGTIVFFEVPNVLYTVRDLGIWDIIYEHCSYFSVSSLVRLFIETGFMVHDVYTEFGKQFLSLEASRAHYGKVNHWKVGTEVNELAALIRDFAEDYCGKVDLWKEKLNRLAEQGRGIVLWGAGSKGVTFLNAVDSADQIKSVVDINPRKKGMYVAGSGQRIISPDSLKKIRPDIVLIMNPNYRNEIQEIISQLGIDAAVMAV